MFFKVWIQLVVCMLSYCLKKRNPSLRKQVTSLQSLWLENGKQIIIGINQIIIGIIFISLNTVLLYVFCLIILRKKYFFLSNINSGWQRIKNHAKVNE